jgi:hypothetical protein
MRQQHEPSAALTVATAVVGCSRTVGASGDLTLEEVRERTGRAPHFVGDADQPTGGDLPAPAVDVDDALARCS